MFIWESIKSDLRLLISFIPIPMLTLTLTLYVFLRETRGNQTGIYYIYFFPRNKCFAIILRNSRLLLNARVFFEFQTLSDEKIQFE